MNILKRNMVKSLVFTLVVLLIIPSHSQAETKTAYFAGGCFWCTEADFEKIDGVKDVISGYMGGHVANPTYDKISTGFTGHRETVKVVYDDELISYSHLLDAFWRMHDPTDGTGSFVDRGFQYSSAIYTSDANEISLINKSIEKLTAEKKYPKPIVTVIEPAAPFYLAEDHHQDYYKKEPYRYTYYRYRSGRDAHILEYWGNE